MDARDFYRLQTPTSWAGPPAYYSFSSMKRMATCLRQWQLARSSYGDLASYPERPSEAAEVGSIVHDLLSRLFRATALVGYPPLGSRAFQAAVAQVDVLGTAREKLDAFTQRALASPRVVGFRREATPRDIYNKVATAFRDEYASVAAQAFGPIPAPDAVTFTGEPQTPADRRALLDRVGVLSEEAVRHPRLPLLGYIDLLVRREGLTTVLDFKTGASRPEYQEQLLLYALMWWRSTGDMADRIELRYGARVESWPVVEADLLRVEREVEAKIARFSVGLSARPAAATVGPHCSGCNVRQLCGDYWRAAGVVSRPRRVGERSDVEVTVKTGGARTGFLAADLLGADVTVVFDEEVGVACGPFVTGETLRVLGAVSDGDTRVLRLVRGTEVFRTG